MRIGVIVAMDKEYNQLKALLSSYVEALQKGQTFLVGQIGDSTLIITKAGIGKVNATFGACNLIDHFNPDVVVSTGCAGGASTDLEVKQVIVSTASCYHDVWCGQPNEKGQVQGLPARYECDSQLVKIAQSIDDGKTIVPGLIVSGDWFVDSVDKMRNILKDFPDATAVDMETAAIAQTCYLHHMPFVSFRVISDIPLKENNAATYDNFWEQIANQSFAVTHQFVQAIINNYQK